MVVYTGKLHHNECLYPFYRFRTSCCECQVTLHAKLLAVRALSQQYSIQCTLVVHWSVLEKGRRLATVVSPPRQSPCNSCALLAAAGWYKSDCDVVVAVLILPTVGCCNCSINCTPHAGPNARNKLFVVTIGTHPADSACNAPWQTCSAMQSVGTHQVQRNL